MVVGQEHLGTIEVRPYDSNVLPLLERENAFVVFQKDDRLLGSFESVPYVFFAVDQINAVVKVWLFLHWHITSHHE